MNHDSIEIKNVVFSLEANSATSLDGFAGLLFQTLMGCGG